MWAVIRVAVKLDPNLPESRATELWAQAVEVIEANWINVHAEIDDFDAVAKVTTTRNVNRPTLNASFKIEFHKTIEDDPWCDNARRDITELIGHAADNASDSIVALANPGVLVTYSSSTE